MTPARRMALIAAAVVVAVVAFIALKPSDSSKKQSSTPTTAANGTKTTGQKPAPPPIPTIVVKNGKPVGGIKQLTFNKGDQIKFTVKSDVSDEVHVHGYDVEAELSPGEPAGIEFDATVPGVFEVELHEAGTVLLTLQVS